MDQAAARVRTRTRPATIEGEVVQPVAPTPRYFVNDFAGLLYEEPEGGDPRQQMTDDDAANVREITKDEFDAIDAAWQSDAGEPMAEGEAEAQMDALPSADQIATSEPSPETEFFGLRYWHHPESGSLFYTENGQDPRVDESGAALGADAALCEEVDEQTFNRLNDEYDRMESEAAAGQGASPTPDATEDPAFVEEVRPSIAAAGAAAVMQAPAPAQSYTDEVGTALVRRTQWGVEHEAREEIRVPIFATAPARVRVGGGATLNIGNMQFVRIDVQVELPCYPEEGEINRAYEFGMAFVEDRLAEEAAKAQGENVQHEELPLDGAHNTNTPGRNIAV